MFNNLLQSFSSSYLPKILSGASKTLNVVNQAIPVYQQIKPIAQNTKSALKIFKSFTTNSSNMNNNKFNNSIKTQINNIPQHKLSNNNPSFFQ